MSTRYIVSLILLTLIIAVVGSTNDQLEDCKSRMYDERMRESSESMDRMNRITLSCETTSGGGGSGRGTGGGSGGNIYGLMLIIVFFFIIVGFFVLVAIGIWCCCCRRKQNMMNPHPGQLGAQEMAYGTDEKPMYNMSIPMGKLPNGNNV